MDKIVSIKRKAQRHVQEGDLDKAVAEYERLLESGELDPYDYVYLGDLLVRSRKVDSAIERYRQAINAYERVGLYKNAIAVGKKVMRVRPEQVDMRRTLGGLYFLEGLLSDALSHYLQYLWTVVPETEAAGIEEVGLRVLGMPLPSAEVALRIVEVMESARCAGSAARPLYDLAAEFSDRGETDGAEQLRQRALALDPAANSPQGAGQVVTLPDAPVREKTGDSGAGEESIDFGMIQLPGESIGGAEAEAESQPVCDPGGGAPGAEALELEDPMDVAPLKVPGLTAAASKEPAAPAPPAAEEEDLDPELAGLSHSELLVKAEEFLEAGETKPALNAFLAAARAAFRDRESRLAEQIYTQMVRTDPNHLEALRGLTEIAHINGERAKIVRFGCELGDVLLAREKYAEAKLEFERVLQFDPKNEKARQRVARLNSIEGVDQVTARPLAPVASEMEGASVSVRGEPGKTQSLVDLSEILSEFQTAVAGQFPAEDGQAHYDLGMTYLEMGMADTALTEFEVAARSEAHREPALEMIARCHLAEGRPEAALQAIEDAVSLGSGDGARAGSLYAYRGLALEALNRLPEALAAIKEALSIDPGLEPAKEALLRLRDAGGEEEEAA